jgi:hypothetical protein
MRYTLTRHPDTPCDALTGIAVAVSCPAAGRLELRYELSGRLSDLVLPAALPAGRADGLWRHSCFEIFIRMAGEAYCEFNFSPSSQWAAYRFDGYRVGMRALGCPPPHIAMQATIAGGELQVALPLADADLAGAASWRIGLAAVIEARGGGLSYWALTYPMGKPDFHHSDCFAAELPAAWRP